MTGQVIITDHLVEQIQRQITHRGMQLRSLNREDVITYLKTNLHWRVTDVSQRGAITPPPPLLGARICL
jgi:tyrosinase